MGDTEEYFPRGGKKPSVTYFKQSGNFLGAAEKGERKKKKPKKKSEGDDGYLSDDPTRNVDLSQRNWATGLSYKTIKPGVLMLGRVRHIHETKVVVMLPCRMIGSVLACHISEPYNKQLEAYVNDQAAKVRDLADMFRPGQYIAVKVLEVEGQSIMLSMMPQHVNGGKTHADLHKGALIQAVVTSVEDHGYVMDLGVPNTRAFLPKSDANPELELDIGLVAWCAVRSVTPSSENSVVALAGTLASLQSGVLRRKPNTPLLPAACVDFTVDTPLDNGIEGHIFEETTAFIQRQHLDKVKGKKPALGQRIRARVLYVMPTRNTPFLTMKNIFETTYPDLETEMKLRDGDIVEEAQVLKIIGRSVHFKLGQGCFGTMSFKRIQVDEDLADEEVISKSYPVGSAHKVRVLCYNLSDYIYSVTDQPEVVSERYFGYGQLRAGELVDATVKAVAENHVVLTLGRMTGVVPHAHLSEGGVFVDPKKARTTMPHKKKYKVGQQVQARVLSVDPVRLALVLTMKPSLLAPDLEVLQSYEQAQPGKAYTGVIKYVRDYVLVAFFNNVSAYVPRKFVTRDMLDNLLDAFHVGQIVTCTILNVIPEIKRMTGSFTTTQFPPDKLRLNGEKRKHRAENNDEIPHKKAKEDEQNDKRDKKKKKKHNKEENPDDEVAKVSEESDEIETDFHEESDQILTAQDMGLIDMSDCVTPKQYKKRIVSLLKSVNCRTRRIDRIDKKIAKIEMKGLNAKNKKFHTAMHSEKLVIEARIPQLLEALKNAQEKLKEFGLEDNKEYKKKKVKKAPEVSEDVVEEVKVEKKKKKKQEIKVVDSLEPVLEVPSAKEFWTTNADDLSKTVQEESGSSEEEELEQPKKKRKKLSVGEKLAKAREEEERVREMERAASESAARPRSTEQFERALLAAPGASQLWIAYMALQLQSTEVDKARAVARKALNTIPFREELEKLNVWLALLNLENRFGTKESQQKTLEEALQMNDTYKVHSKLLDIYVETGKHQELAGLVDLMMRKYKRDPGTYVQCGGACFRLGLVEKARHVMQKAVSVLEKKEHVSVLVQFALLERSHGARERAEALFEQVLAVYPQRVDVCAVYVDMLVKGGDVEHVRQVMERMTSQKLPARKMKVLYKKWIEIEEKLGDQEKVDSIRQRAMDYIEKANF